MTHDADMTMQTDGGTIDPELDTDGDGLPDVWELAAGMPSLLDPLRADTNGDGVSDADEDPDGDGLTNLEEYALSRLVSSPAGCRVSPARKTIALELDSMQDRAPSDDILRAVQSAYAALPVAGLDGSTGVDLCIYRDEESITAMDLDGDPAVRGAFLAAHGPHFSDHATPRIPYAKMVHAMMVTRRLDSTSRGGDTLSDDGGDVERCGVLIYEDAIAALHPACGTPMLPAITVAEATAGSLAHEIGHTLQLGHDTDVGGGIDHWNIMSEQTSCLDGQMRLHGYMNHDPMLGNTEEVSAPRFSAAAAALMEFAHKVSAETAESLGHEM